MSAGLSPSPPAPRIALWLVALLVAGAAVAAGWTYLDQRRTYLDLLERRTAEMARRLAATGDTDRIRAKAPARRVGDAVFRAASETLAAAELQSRLTAIVGGAGARLESVRILDAEGVGAGGKRSSLRRIRLRTRFVADHAALRRMLLAFENHRPPLFADSLSVEAREQGAILAVEMEVSALARIDRREPG